MEEARGRNNARSLFEVERIPCDHHIRHTLDPIALPSQPFLTSFTRALNKLTCLRPCAWWKTPVSLL